MRVYISWWKPVLLWDFGNALVLLGYKYEQVTDTTKCITLLILGMRIQIYKEKP